MDFVENALPSERHIQLKKLTVAASLHLDVKQQPKSHTSIRDALYDTRELPIDLKNLIIKRVASGGGRHSYVLSYFDEKT
jgi:hypothetical protein